jgi:RNA polymerase sigma factor (sigma-70 family)
MQYLRSSYFIPAITIYFDIGNKMTDKLVFTSDTERTGMKGESRRARFEASTLPHMQAAYNFARWLVRSDQNAEDIVQDAYLRAYKFFDGFHGEDARAWLLAIVRNTAYSWLQKNREHTENTTFMEEFDSLSEEGTATLLSPADNNPEAILTRNGDRQLLNQALEQLPVEFREVMVLRELEDLSYKEIANIAGIPIGTVMSRLARGRKLLLECLEQCNKEARNGL